MPNTREKLIELLDGKTDDDWYTVGDIADHLIANGVTIPVRCWECKHGIWDEENEMWKCIESAEYDSNFGDYIGWVHYHNADYYCADGERRNEQC